MAKQLMATGNPLFEDPSPSEEEIAEGLKRQQLKHLEAVE